MNKLVILIALLMQLTGCAIIVTEVHTNDDIRVCTGDLKLDVDVEALNKK